jgi:hypothetical protein
MASARPMEGGHIEDSPCRKRAYLTHFPHAWLLFPRWDVANAPSYHLGIRRPTSALIGSITVTKTSTIMSMIRTSDVRMSAFQLLVVTLSPVDLPNPRPWPGNPTV